MASTTVTTAVRPSGTAATASVNGGHKHDQGTPRPAAGPPRKSPRRWRRPECPDISHLVKLKLGGGWARPTPSPAAPRSAHLRVHAGGGDQGLRAARRSPSSRNTPYSPVDHGGLLLHLGLCVFVSTGTLSPVRADSSHLRLADLRCLASAGIKSPASSRMISPGTTGRRGSRNDAVAQPLRQGARHVQEGVQRHLPPCFPAARPKYAVEHHNGEDE